MSGEEKTEQAGRGDLSLNSTVLLTERLQLCVWRDDHLAAFASLHADPKVMADLGGPLDLAQSAEKLARYRRGHADHGISRWAVEDRSGEFLGYAGVMFQPDPKQSLGPHYEIGWRFRRETWGQGYATESARAALRDAFDSHAIEEVLSYTLRDNLRSQRVMEKIGMARAAERDFVSDYPRVGLWPGLVWAAFNPRARNAATSRDTMGSFRR